jgi:hypothetical protein
VDKAAGNGTDPGRVAADSEGGEFHVTVSVLVSVPPLGTGM